MMIIEEEDILIGKRLRALRLFHGINSMTFKKIFDINASMLWRYETAKSIIPAKLLYKIARFFSKKVEYFFEEDKKNVTI